MIRPTYVSWAVCVLCGDAQRNNARRTMPCCACTARLGDVVKRVVISSAVDPVLPVEEAIAASKASALSSRKIGLSFVEKSREKSRDRQRRILVARFRVDISAAETPIWHIVRATMREYCPYIHLSETTPTVSYGATRVRCVVNVTLSTDSSVWGALQGLLSWMLDYALAGLHFTSPDAHSLFRACIEQHPDVTSWIAAGALPILGLQERAILAMLANGGR